jgi:hypothetical protein
VSLVAPETLALGFKLFEGGDEVVQPLPFLFDHRRRSARDETRVGEFGLGLADFALQARDFLVQSLAFDGKVDLDLQHQPGFANDRDGCAGAAWQIVDNLHFGELAERFQIRSEAEQ